MIIRRVDCLDLPELAPYRSLRRSEAQRRDGIFVAEGDKVVRLLLDSGLAVDSVLASDEQWRRLAGLAASQRVGDVFLAERRLVASIVGFPLHQAILAVGRVPPAVNLAALLARAPRPHLLVVLDGLSGPDNVGMEVRNAAAFGATALVAGEASASPWLRRSVRNSMGTIFSLPIVEVDRLVGFLRELRAAHGFRILAAATGADAIWHVPLEGDLAIVFGSEGHGIGEDVLAATEGRVGLPMAAGVDSLNVASASAAILAEVRRRVPRATAL